MSACWFRCIAWVAIAVVGVVSAACAGETAEPATGSQAWSDAGVSDVAAQPGAPPPADAVAGQDASVPPEVAAVPAEVAAVPPEVVAGPPEVAIGTEVGADAETSASTDVSDLSNEAEVGDGAAPDAGPAAADVALQDQQPPPDLDDAGVADGAEPADVPPAPTADSASPAPDAAPQPVGQSLGVTVQNPGGQAGYLTIFALPIDVLDQFAAPSLSDLTTLHDGAVAQWPLTAQVTLPPGTWLVGAMLAKGAGGLEQVSAVAMHCTTGLALPLTAAKSGPALAPVQLDLKPMKQFKGFSAECALKAPPQGPTSLVTVAQVVEPPPTVNGGAHLLDAVVQAERLWVAGHQDSLVTFDFPAGKSAGPLAGWQTHGKGACARIARSDTRVYCTNRTAHVFAASVEPGTLQPKGFTLAPLPEGSHPEGLAVRGDLLYLANHAQGLLAVTAPPPYTSKPCVTQGLTDAWDVAPLGPGHLLVADGAAGLQVLAVPPGQELTPQPVSKLALSGLSAYLHVAGAQAVVGALSGGLHVVDLSNPAQPKLQGTLSLPMPIYGVTVQAGVVAGAAGSALLLADLPAVGQTVGTLTVRDLEPSLHFAMDVQAFGAGLLSAEFTAVRRLDLHLQAPAGPIVQVPKAVLARVVAVGQTIQTTLPIRNAGTQPLKIKAVQFSEGMQPADSPLQLLAPTTLPPGGQVVVQVQAKKAQKGVLQHLVQVLSDDPASPLAVTHLHEITELQPGDPLPPLSYAEASGKVLNVGKHLQGKPGVVLVAAHSCPVAFLGLAMAGHDLKPWLDKGKLAAVAIDPWVKPSPGDESAVLKLPFPVLFSPLTTSDGHDYSEVLDVTLGQPEYNGAPMPIVYVVDPTGKITYVELGYVPGRLLAAVQALAGPP